MNNSYEMPRFLQHIKDINRSQSDMIRTFERGQKQGFLNVRELKDYNRQLDDYKRKLADIERHHRAISSARQHVQTRNDFNRSIGNAPSQRDIQKLETLTRKEKQLFQLRREAGRHLAMQEKNQGKVAALGQRGAVIARQQREGTIMGYAGRGLRMAGAAALGVAGYGFAQTMAGAQAHTQFQMSRGATERLAGGVFARGRLVPKAGVRGRWNLSQQMLRQFQKEGIPLDADKKAPGVAWQLAASLTGLDVTGQIARQNRMGARARYLKKQYKRKASGYRLPGEMAQYEGYGMSLGYSIPEAHQLAQGGLRSLPGNRLQGMRSNLAMMRGFSLDAGSIYGFHRSSRGGGYEGGAAALNRELINAFTKGKFPRALMGEFVQAATNVLDTYNASGGVTSPRSAANMLAVMGNVMGRGYRGDPSRTAGFINRFSSGIRSPGGGEAGKAFQYRAFGLGRGASLWDVMKRQYQGATPENVRSILDYGTQNYGDYAKYALHNIYGLTPQQVDKLMTGYNSGGLSNSAISKIVKGPNEFGQAAAFRPRMGFRGLELKKLQEQANAAAKNIKAITTAYNLNIVAIQTSTLWLMLLADKAEYLVRKLSPGGMVPDFKSPTGAK